MLELRLRLNLRYWAKYPEGCRFAGIGASGDEKPVEFGNKQRSSCAGYRRDVGRATVGVSLRVEHIHVSVAAAEVHALALRIAEEISVSPHAPTAAIALPSRTENTLSCGGFRNATKTRPELSSRAIGKLLPLPIGQLAVCLLAKRSTTAISRACGTFTKMRRSERAS